MKYIIVLTFLSIVCIPFARAQTDLPYPGSLSTRAAGPDMQLSLAVGDYLNGDIDDAEQSLDELSESLVGNNLRLAATVQYCLGLIYLERAFFEYEKFSDPRESTPGVGAIHYLELAADAFEKVIGDGNAYALGVREALMCDVGTFAPMLARRAAAVLERALPLYREIPDAGVDGFIDAIQLMLGIAYLSVALHEEANGECIQSEASLRLSRSYFARVGRDTGLNLTAFINRYDRLRRETNPTYPAFGFLLEDVENGWEWLLDRTGAIYDPLIDVHLHVGRSVDREVLLPGRSRPENENRDHSTDGLFRLNAAVDLTWEVLKDNYRETDEPGWDRLELGTSFYTRNRYYNDVEKADFNENRGSVFLNWLPEPASPHHPGLLLGLEYSYIASRSNNGSMFRTHRFMPSLTAIWDWEPFGEGYPREALDQTRLYATFDLRDDREDLPREELDRDGDTFSVGIEHHGFPWKASELFYLAPYFDSMPGRLCAYQDEYLNYSVYGRIARDRTAGDEFEGVRYMVGAGVEVPLWWSLVGDANLQFTWREFENPSDFGPDTKDDRQEQAMGAGGGISWRIADMDTMTARMRVGAGYYMNDSNFNLYEYDRSMYTIELEIGFGPHPRKGPDYSKQNDWFTDPPPEDDLEPIVD